MVWAVVSSIWAPDGLATLWGASRVVLVVVAGLVFLAAIRGLGGDHREYAQQALCYGTVAFIALLAIEYISDGAFVRFLLGERISPGLQYTNHASAIFGVLIWPVGFVVSRRAESDGVLALCILGALVVIWVLPMKASLVALVFGIIAAGMTYIFRMRAMYFIAASIAVSMLVLPLPFTIPASQQVIADQRRDIRLNWQERLVAWEFVSNKAMKAPLLGHGFRASRQIGVDAGSIRVAEPNNPGSMGKLRKLPLHPHNWVLQLWLELGLIGVGFGVLLVTGLVHAIGKYRGDRIFTTAAMGSLVTFFCIASLSFGFWQKWWLATGWLALGALALVAPRPEDRS